MLICQQELRCAVCTYKHPNVYKCTWHQDTLICWLLTNFIIIIIRSIARKHNALSILVMCWMSSLSSQWYLIVHGSLSCVRVFCGLGEDSDASLGGSCGSCLGNMAYLAFCYELFSPCTISVRTWTHSQYKFNVTGLNTINHKFYGQNF